jgi:hypothetical protein
MLGRAALDAMASLPPSFSYCHTANTIGRTDRCRKSRGRSFRLLLRVLPATKQTNRNEMRRQSHVRWFRRHTVMRGQRAQNADWNVNSRLHRKLGREL